MSRIVHYAMALVLLAGIAGCSAAVKETPAANPRDTPTPDADDMKKQMETMNKYQDQSQQQPPAGETK